MGREHVHLLLWWISASGEVIIRKIGEWVQDAGWEMDNSVRHGRRAAVKAVNRSDLWHPYGLLKQREDGGYWIPPPQIMINGNSEMWRKSENPRVSCPNVRLHHLFLFSYFFCSWKVFLFFPVFLSPSQMWKQCGSVQQCSRDLCGQGLSRKWKRLLYE